jgi:hypothetical protein
MKFLFKQLITRRNMNRLLVTYHASPDALLVGNGRAERGQGNKAQQKDNRMTAACW